MENELRHDWGPTSNICIFESAYVSEKWAIDVNRHASNENIQISSKHIKKKPTLSISIHLKCKSKATIRPLLAASVAEAVEELLMGMYSAAAIFLGISSISEHRRCL